MVREQLRRFQDTEIDNAGDGFLVSFDGGARALRCAAAMREAARGLGLETRSGIHAGECEVSSTKLVGIAVHIGSTVKDLVGGSGITFEDRGAHALKGIPDEWHLYAARLWPLSQ